jgi:hypothetical protein
VVREARRNAVGKRAAALELECLRRINTDRFGRGDEISSGRFRGLQVAERSLMQPLDSKTWHPRQRLKQRDRRIVQSPGNCIKTHT